MKYIDNRINANIVKLEDENNNYMSEDVEGALEEIDSKIKEKESYMNKLRRKNIAYEVANYPVITFIDDDGFSYFLEAIKPIFDKYGIKGSLGIITDNINKKYYLTEEQLHDLQDEGYSILSHTKSHSANVFKSGAVNLSTVSDDAILEEYETAYNWLNSRGFKGADTLVYPWGFFGNETLRYKNLARRYYNNAVNAGGGVNTTNIKDNMYLNRYFIQKTNDLTNYINIIDQCVSSKGWLIFGTHSNSNEIDPAHFESVVSYAVNSGAKILPFIEANEIKGNAIQIGEFSSEDSFYVAKNGEVKHNTIGRSYSYDYSESKEFSMDKLPTDFKRGIHSIPIASKHDNLTTRGGNLILYNNGGDFTFETFVPFEKTDMYIRKFDFRSTPNRWLEWELLNSSFDECTISNINSEYTLVEAVIRKYQNTVTGSFRLEHPSRTGTFAHGTNMLTINNLTLEFASTIQPCTLTSSSGVVTPGYFYMFNDGGNVIA